jgi:hypothetical protein
MKDNEIRIAIAEACGWKNCKCNEGQPDGEPDDDFNRDVVEHRSHTPYCGFPTEPHREIIPDYLNDLNAMHEAEKMLSQSQGTDYGIELNTIMDRDFCKGIAAPHGDCDWHATAAQRCEAFLRCLGKWKEDDVPSPI